MVTESEQRKRVDTKGYEMSRTGCESMAEPSWESMVAMWQPAESGVRLLRLFGQSQEAILPDRIEGRPVTEIGPYCFSASERYPREGYQLTGMIRRLFVDKAPMERAGEWTEHRIDGIDRVDLPAICGKYVERVWMPDTVTTLHNAAFYNCRNLRQISLGGQIRAIGSDEFMNCLRLNRLILRGSVEEENGLELLLERLTTDVEIHFQPGDRKRMLARGEECVLFFPEYYEWLNEVTPAHIFSRSIEGEGLRMRRVFRDGRLDLSKYDQCYPSVMLSETDENLCRIALCRLQYPLKLSRESADLYEKAMRERPQQLMEILLQDRDAEALQFVCRKLSPETGVLSQWMERCIAAEWGEAVAYLMDAKRSKMTEKKYDFDDFDTFDDPEDDM